MRYLYQQLMAFWVVIAVILLIVGISFTQLTKQTMEDNNYRQLFGYAESVAKTAQNYAELPNAGATTPDESLHNSLMFTELALNQQDVNFVFVDKSGKSTYPTNANVHFSITKTQWTALKAGERQKKTSDTNVFGEHEVTSYAMVPFNLEGEFYGALIVTQPAKNISDSVNAVTLNLFKGFIISSVIALIISYFYASMQVRRINRMKKATKEIASGNFDVQLPVHDKDEFDELADDFNKMTVSLKESQEEIERQEERRKQFMADASHEMRTPLTTINGLLEGLEYNAIPENQKGNAVRLMKNETERLIRLVNENLDYEKIRTNQISIVVKKFNGTEALKNILTQLETKAEAAGDKLHFEVKEPIEVYADYDRFVQVVVNIIQNAIQFTQDGDIYVNLKKGYLETIVEIQDTGIGMTEEQQRNIWDRYYKADPSRKNRKFGESGLGLPIVQQLVRLHKGTIKVESKLNEGTKFTITFPDVEIVDDTKEK